MAQTAGRHLYTDKDLYLSGGPSSRDIAQDQLADCYLVASMGALAKQQPDRVREAISYDERTQKFTVTLYQEQSIGRLGLGGGEPKPIRIELNQAEVYGNFQRGGGSTIDNTGATAPIWPAILETAYAKMHDSDPKDGLREGYDRIRNGGQPHEAMYALTGVRGETIRAGQWDDMGNDKAFELLDTAMKAHRPLTLATQDEKRSWLGLGESAPRDGLTNNHAFTIEAVYRGRDGEINLQLRNPIGNNLRNHEGMDDPSPTVHVRLVDIIDSGGLSRIDIGPSPGERPMACKKIECQSGNVYIDSMLSNLHDPSALKQTMRELAASPEGQAFAAEGRTQYQAMHTEPAPPQLEETQAPSRGGMSRA